MGVSELSQQEARRRIRVPKSDTDIVSGELWRLEALGIEERDDGAQVVLLAGFSS